MCVVPWAAQGCNGFILAGVLSSLRPELVGAGARRRGGRCDNAHNELSVAPSPDAAGECCTPATTRSHVTRNPRDVETARRQAGRVLRGSKRARSLSQSGSRFVSTLGSASAQGWY